MQNYIIASKEYLAEEFVYSMELEAMSDGEIFKLIDECASYITDKQLFSQKQNLQIMLGVFHSRSKKIFLPSQPITNLKTQNT